MGNVTRLLRSPNGRYAMFTAIVLTLLVLTSSIWNINNIDRQATYLATEEAKTNWDKDQAFRLWATRHGGVYVKPNKRTPPNPYLSHLPNRDVETTDGVKLTLMNPAYMMAQLLKEYEKIYRIKGKITAQILLNPANKPDPWELKALKLFDKGVPEVTEQADIDGNPYIRLIRPMVMTEGCMMCHGQLGFKVGDIRGGVSVSIPLTPYLIAAESSKQTLHITHAAVWLVGMLAIFFVSWRAYRRETERMQASRVLNDTITQLLEAKDDAEAANRTKSEFLGSMSHELRTPLNAVLGFAQMLKYDQAFPLSSGQVDHVESIISGGSHLLDLVNDILDLAKIDAEEATFNLEEVNANEAVEGCMALMVPIGNLREIKLLNNFSSGTTVSLRTDPIRFKQTMLNLLSNAVKYNKDGGSVTVEGREVESGYLRIFVKDTGSGIARKDLANIFEMYHRLGEDAARAKEGTGIGLTVTKMIVERMAGRIGFDSEEGVGSTFWIELPLASNQNVLVWTDDLRIGIEALDKDHRVLFSLLNKILHDPAEDDELESVIGELIRYTNYHFRREEAVMEACGYPDFAEHRQFHQKLALQVSTLADDWRRERSQDTAEKLRVFLRGWLSNHVMDRDIEILQFTKGNEQNISKALENLI
jgi:hemerythrin-like metal-binding protein